MTNEGIESTGAWVQKAQSLKMLVIIFVRNVSFVKNVRISTRNL